MDASAQNRLSEMSALIPPEKVRTFKRQADLDSFIEEKYNPDVLKALQASVKSQRSVVRELHEAGLNGQAESLERLYRIQTQELQRKETLMGKLWRGVTAPFRFIGRQFKEHPVRTTLIAALLVGGAYLYFSGTGAALIAKAQAWLAKKMGGQVLAQAGETVATGADKAAEVLTGAAESLPVPSAPNVPVPAPTVPAPLPTEVPGINEAEELFRHLRRT
jgi:hypothetical protein